MSVKAGGQRQLPHPPTLNQIYHLPDIIPGAQTFQPAQPIITVDVFWKKEFQNTVVCGILSSKAFRIK
jgi:hypothetical protein